MPLGGVPTASERGAQSEVAHKWPRWLHNPYRLGGSPPLQRGRHNQKLPTSPFRLGGHHRFGAGATSGPQVGKVAGYITHAVRFAHFAMLVDPGPAAAERPPLLLPPQAPGRGLQERPRVAALQLFMGHTTYSPERQVMMKRWLDASNPHGGVPTASERGPEVAHKWARWLHNPSHGAGTHSIEGKKW